jgi:hypothetical protein
VVFNAESDIVAALKAELARRETDYQECCRRLQRYSDTLHAISKLDHAHVQSAIVFAREALKD